MGSSLTHDGSGLETGVDVTTDMTFTAAPAELPTGLVNLIGTLPDFGDL